MSTPETVSASSVEFEGTHSGSSIPHVAHIPPAPQILAPETEASSVESEATTNCSHDCRSQGGSPHAKEINVRSSEKSLSQGSGHYLETEDDYV